MLIKDFQEISSVVNIVIVKYYLVLVFGYVVFVQSNSLI